MSLKQSQASGWTRVLAVRNDIDIKLDLFATKDGWYQLRWIRAEADGVTATIKQIGISRDEMTEIVKAVTRHENPIEGGE